MPSSRHFSANRFARSRYACSLGVSATISPLADGDFPGELAARSPQNHILQASELTLK